MSLYTKYRPKDWDELIGQDAICTILKTSLQTGRVGHAYMFTGSRGTGKTSSARILAKGINCSDLNNGNPCHTCKNCKDFDAGSFIDVVELDAASHTQVDKMRSLIETASFAPNQGKYKIFIIDEVHMLSDGAFNALLKTLEEPPAHVKFILATTEIQKVPETIRSRTLRFDFGRVPTEVLFAHLQNITKQEGIDAEEKALKVIAQSARGGVRDALTLLEQNTIDNKLSTGQVMATLSLIDESLITNIVSCLYEYNTQEIKEIIQKLKNEHIEVQGFFDSILYFLRDRLIETIGSEKFERYNEIFQENYRDIKFIPDGLLLIEITLLRACTPKQQSIPQKQAPEKTQNETQNPQQKQDPKPNSAPTKIQKTPVPPPKENPPQATKTPQPKDETPPKKDETPSKKEETPKTPPVENFSYRRLLDALGDHSGIRFALKSASFSCEGTCLTLSFTSKWNHDKVADPEAIILIQERLNSLFGGQWTLVCNINKNPDTSYVEEVFV
ncbi:DNA polymerase III, subunit gamma and tau [Candidatus Gracilibacteria bacterium]|nr:MAG: DNA polymerase III, subunit gamma and tau [Candidatus Gracilibacteria bacterium]